MKTAILNFIRDEEGATAIEYALIAGIIALGLALVLDPVRTEIGRIFGLIDTELKKAK